MSRAVTVVAEDLAVVVDDDALFGPTVVTIRRAGADVVDLTPVLAAALAAALFTTAARAIGPDTDDATAVVSHLADAVADVRRHLDMPATKEAR